jgi:hypothetical protein
VPCAEDVLPPHRPEIAPHLEHLQRDARATVSLVLCVAREARCGRTISHASSRVPFDMRARERCSSSDSSERAPFDAVSSSSERDAAARDGSAGATLAKPRCSSRCVTGSLAVGRLTGGFVGGRGGGTVILPDGARMVNLPDGARVMFPDALRRGDGAGANLVVAGGT